jgi:hypothetical protein
MARALVWRFENTDSFDNGRANLGDLERIPPETWNGELKRRARQAVHDNPQLRKLLVGAESGASALERLWESDKITAG